MCLKNLVAVLHVPLEDADYVVNVQAGVSVFLQPHCVTEDQRKSPTTSSCLNVVGAILQEV